MKILNIAFIGYNLKKAEISLTLFIRSQTCLLTEKNVSVHHIFCLSGNVSDCVEQDVHSHCTLPVCLSERLLIWLLTKCKY